MSAIPEDIQRAANHVIALHRQVDGSAMSRVREATQLIARAILAERERCQPAIEVVRMLLCVDFEHPTEHDDLLLESVLNDARDVLSQDIPHSLPETPSQAAKPHGVPPPTPCGTPNPAGEP
ncbi:hypothetical protein [Mesorhizobium sp. URHB0026]